MPSQKNEGNFSYADYLAWPEEERWEIMDGIAYMQASPSPVHQEISVGLVTQFYQYLLDKPCKVYAAPFCVRLVSGDEKKNEEIKKVVEPDITIVCDQSKIDEKGCSGAPDLIVEITSPSTAKIDKLIKFTRYEKAGVREYWIVEPDIKLVSVFTLQEDQRYGRPDIYTEHDQIRVAIFPDLVVDLKPVLAGE